MQEFKHDFLERANQMVSLCHNADVSADQTVITLAEQHEQLTNIDTHLTSIDTTLMDTKQDINRMKGIFRRVIDTFRSKPHTKIVSKILAHSRKRQSASSSPQRRQIPLKSLELNISASTSVLDEQIDEVFYQMDQFIHRLKDKAYIINDQLVGQADLLDHIHERMIDSTDHVEQQNLDIKKLKSTK